MYANIRKLPTNSAGKDYVVGDLHGCFDLVLRLLEEVGFDESCDRLFSVGDLIDRGPDSLECLRLLEKPWLYAVQGNHEKMLLNYFLSYIENSYINGIDDNDQCSFMSYGGDWVKRYFIGPNKCMTPYFDCALRLAMNLPLMWVVGEGENRFHIIHAELLRAGFHKSREWVWLDSDIDRWLDQQQIPNIVEHNLCWSRTLMTTWQPLPVTQSGLSTTFCGHTPDVKPRQVLSHICLDTGGFLSTDAYQNRCVGDHRLTLFDVKECCWVSASYRDEKSIWGDFKAMDTNFGAV